MDKFSQVEQYNLDAFITAVNKLLESRNERALYEEDSSSLIHCFGYGNSPEMAALNILHGRKQAKL